ncbi:hypothetical protein CRUP_007851 [Coryphaenoides rupestris]|nr:hypothetical protein CRUP_007851 [Coryphaenoides rupestris]
MKHLKTVPSELCVPLVPPLLRWQWRRAFPDGVRSLGSPESYFQQLPATLNHKRNKLAACLESDEPLDSRFVKWLIKKKGLAAIPVSAFYSPEHSKEFQNYVRFCFTKGLAAIPVSAFYSPEHSKEFQNYSAILPSLRYG